MTTHRMTQDNSDRTAARLGRIVIIGMAILEAIAIAAAILSKSGHGIL